MIRIFLRRRAFLYYEKRIRSAGSRHYSRSIVERTHSAIPTCHSHDSVFSAPSATIYSLFISCGNFIQHVMWFCLLKIVLQLGKCVLVRGVSMESQKVKSLNSFTLVMETHAVMKVPEKRCLFLVYSPILKMVRRRTFCYIL